MGTRWTGLILGILVSITGCGGGDPAAQGEPPVESWMGARPQEPSAAETYDLAAQLVRGRQDREEMWEIGMLAFHRDTLPALLALMERGRPLQRRAAWMGLRAVVDGIAYLGYTARMKRQDFDLKKYRPEALDWLGRKGNRDRIVKALEGLPEPSRHVFKATVDRIPELRDRPSWERD